MTKHHYLRPDAEILPLAPESIICTSGEGGDLIIDDPVNPWSAPLLVHNPFED